MGDFESSGSSWARILDEGRVYLPTDATRHFSNIADLFPRFEAQSLCGLALGARDARVGTLVLVHDAPMESDLTAHPAVRIVAARAASEIRHQRAIAERRELEANLLETQRLESLGVLAGGVAHDFNNLLAIIVGHADITLAQGGLTEAQRHSIEQILDAAGRASDLTGTMLDYAGGLPVAHESLDLAELTSDTIGLLRSSVSKNAMLDVDTPPNAFVEGHAGQLSQVIVNLVTNAAESLPEQGGRISVSLIGIELGDRDVQRFGGEIRPGAAWALTVSDNGAGMKPEIERRIFDPFFTTKESGRGLGLSAVLGIVKSHHGAVHLESERGRGTTIEIVLPRATPAAVKTAPADAWEGHGQVLVVDDEPGVRELVASMLISQGFEADEAGSGEEALARFDQDPARYDAVVLDLAMPGMDGLAVRRALHEQRPELPVLMMSGYADPGIANPGFEGALAGAGSPFIRKPFRVERLMRKVSEMLAAATGASAPPHG